MRSIAWRTSASEAKPTSVRSRRPPRSTHTGPGPLTMTSSTAGSRKQRLERPEPERALGDARDEVVAGARVEQGGLAVDERADPRVEVDAAVGRLGDQALAQRGGEVVEGGGAGIGVHGSTRPGRRRFAPGTTEGRDLAVPPLV